MTDPTMGPPIRADVVVARDVGMHGSGVIRLAKNAIRRLSEPRHGAPTIVLILGLKTKSVIAFGPASIFSLGGPQPAAADFAVLATSLKSLF